MKYRMKILTLTFALPVAFSSCKDGLTAFRPYVNEYSNIPNLNTYQGQPYILPKVVFIEKATDEGVILHLNRADEAFLSSTLREDISGLTLDLPSRLQPETPEEVRTLVWLQWGKQLKNEESTISSAGVTAHHKYYQYTCDITVIDWQKRVVVDKKTFMGKFPTTVRVSPDQDINSELPTKEILSYIGQCWLDSIRRGIGLPRDAIENPNN